MTLAISQVVASQTQKEVTINEATSQLESAITDVLNFDLTTLGSTVMTDSQFQRNIGFTFTHDTQAETITLPTTAIPRFFFVDNSAGTDDLDVIKGSTTITVVAGGVVSLLTDGTTNNLTLVSSSAAMPFDIGGYTVGLPAANDIVFRFLFTRAVVFPSGLTGSQAAVVTAPTTSALTFDIFQDLTDRGDISIAAAASTGTFTFSTEITYAIGDYMAVDVNAVDSGATASDIMITLKGTRDA